MISSESCKSKSRKCIARQFAGRSNNGAGDETHLMDVAVQEKKSEQVQPQQQSLLTRITGCAFVAQNFLRICDCSDVPEQQNMKIISLPHATMNGGHSVWNVRWRTTRVNQIQKMKKTNNSTTAMNIRPQQISTVDSPLHEGVK